MVLDCGNCGEVVKKNKSVRENQGYLTIKEGGCVCDPVL